MEKGFNLSPLGKRRLVFYVLIGTSCLILFLIFRELFPNVLFGSAHSSNKKMVNVVNVRFDDAAVLKDWKEYVFNGRSEYKVEADPNGEMVLHATSKAGHSVIFKVVNIPLEARPILAWQWRAQKFPSNKKHQSLFDENDFSIRVCAVFARNNPLLTDIVQYVWDDYLPVGTRVASPYSKNVQMLILEKGRPNSSKEWLIEKRDLLNDYKKLFGKIHYRNLKAIAIISNSDDTKTESEAFIKRIWIESANAERLHKKHRGIRGDISSLGHGLRSLKRFCLSILKRPVPFTFW